MNDYTERLRREGLHLIILKDGKTIFTSSEEGKRPLLEAINRIGLPELNGSTVVDKIVGKAVAILISYFKAKETHCIVLSVRAKEVLDKHGINYYSEKVIPEIRNKLGTDICPFEKIVLDVEDLKEGYEKLSARLEFQRRI